MSRQIFAATDTAEIADSAEKIADSAATTDAVAAKVSPDAPEKLSRPERVTGVAETADKSADGVTAATSPDASQKTSRPEELETPADSATPVEKAAYTAHTPAHTPADSATPARTAADGAGKSRRAGWLLALAALFWGTSFYPTAVVLRELSEGEYLLVRFALATLAFGAICARQIAAASARTAAAGLGAGLFLGAAFFTQTLAFAGAASSTIAFLTSTTIIFVPVFAFFAARVLPSARAAFAALIALCGLYLLSGAALFDGSRGELLALACAVFFAAHIVFCERALAAGCELRAFVFWQFAGATAVFAATALALGQRLAPSSFSPAAAAFCAYGALVLTIFCFFAQNYAQKFIPAHKIAILLAIEPLSAGVLGAAMGEQLGAAGWAGAALIIIGVIFS